MKRRCRGDDVEKEVMTIGIEEVMGRRSRGGGVEEMVMSNRCRGGGIEEVRTDQRREGKLLIFVLEEDEDVRHQQNLHIWTQG